MHRDSYWGNYISELDALPRLSDLWEKELVSELRRRIPSKPGMKVLEIGCSNGRWLRWFKQVYGAQIYGVDLNPIRASMVENFILADGLTLPIAGGVFDVVFSMGLVEHFSNAQLRHSLVAEHVRMAKHGTGLVWLEHPNMNLSLDWLYVKLWYDYRLGSRHYSMTAGETKRHFRDLGVEVLSARFIGWIPPRLLDIMMSKLHQYVPFLPGTSGEFGRRKLFEHFLTADNFLIIGRRS